MKSKITRKIDKKADTKCGLYEGVLWKEQYGITAIAFIKNEKRGVIIHMSKETSNHKVGDFFTYGGPYALPFSAVWKPFDGKISLEN